MDLKSLFHHHHPEIGDDFTNEVKHNENQEGGIKREIGMITGKRHTLALSGE
jgi:hypothetical protein